MRKNILIVDANLDPDSSMERMIEFILTRNDYSVIAKAKGKGDAVEKLQSNEPDIDLIVLNTIIESDNVQTIEAMREINTEIPIIALVGVRPDDPNNPNPINDRSHPEVQRLVAMRHAGVNELVPKPLKLEAFLEAVAKMLGES